MKLVELRLENYKRFEDLTRIDLVPKVLALIGPNEAGKSSIFTALPFLNQHQGPNRSHRSHGVEADLSIAATFLLSPEDQSALSAIPGNPQIKQYTFESRLEDSSATYYYNLSPNPRRDLSPRRALADRLESLVEAERILTQFISVNNLVIKDAYQKVLGHLRSSSDSLTDSQLASLKELVNGIHYFTNGESVETPVIANNEISNEFEEILQVLLSYDEGPSPSRQAATILGARRPQFRLFTAEDRLIESTYAIDTFANPPRALANLARLADLDLIQLRDAADSEHAGRRATLLTKANDRLCEQFRGLWPQHDLTAFLQYNHPNLEITFSSPDGEFSVPAERSDGLKSFVALRAFLAAHDDLALPILLVDEAETHLHYDAQANLVEMFARQTLVDKVIYTTHSAGCLPMDLGYGIRVVEPISATKRSRVRKSIWDGEFSGFSPLIFAMGATTFAFLPARNVLLTEGETDAVLLPTLFSEVDAGSLPFQIAPGISNSSLSSYPDLRHEGGSVLFLVDGDDGGDELREGLRTARVPARDIFSLKQSIGDGVVLEDSVNPTHYAAAANSVMSFYYPGDARVSAHDVDAPGRPDALATWCLANGISAPAKLAVCQALLDLKSDAVRAGQSLQLLDPTVKSSVRKLVIKLCRRFPDLPSYGN